MKNNKNILYVAYKEITTGGENLSDDQYSDRSDEHTEFSVKSVYTDDHPNTGAINQHSVEVNFTPVGGKVVYVVVIRYSTGDTFGSSYGCGHIEGVYDSFELAEKIQHAIFNGYKEPKENFSSYRKPYEEYRSLKNIPKEEYLYLPHEGYFESLEDVEIYTKRINSL